MPARTGTTIEEESAEAACGVGCGLLEGSIIGRAQSAPNVKISWEWCYTIYNRFQPKRSATAILLLSSGI